MCEVSGDGKQQCIRTVRLHGADKGEPNHTGWYSDEYQSDKIRGLVMRLPHSRGFLAGWSMGEHMASEVEPYAYATIEEAARAADSLAENAAERQREHEEKERAECEAIEQEAEDEEAHDLACRDAATV